ncbi:Arm DNA-binding domain-containing protein [Sphingobium yanoikuyae]|uniref:Arm DNA-binding domain-containing protein n=1 Tax=Sphingobium yanoikuyae TaxID=13690 RepID=UPI001F225CDC|nr:Arm DNA-binding domain-containing protein [Sphingobium yanoikuyae]
MPLKELEVRYASRRSKDYKLGDGGGLYLLVRPTGSRLWRMKYRFDGKEKLLSFGRYPEVTLAEARLRRAEAKLALARGEDPGPRAASPVTCFEAAARAWHGNRAGALECPAITAKARVRSTRLIKTAASQELAAERVDRAARLEKERTHPAMSCVIVCAAEVAQLG